MTFQCPHKVIDCTQVLTNSFLCLCVKNEIVPSTGLSSWAGSTRGFSKLFSDISSRAERAGIFTVTCGPVPNLEDERVNLSRNKMGHIKLHQVLDSCELCSL